MTARKLEATSNSNARLHQSFRRCIVSSLCNCIIKREPIKKDRRPRFLIHAYIIINAYGEEKSHARAHALSSDQPGKAQSSSFKFLHLLRAIIHLTGA